MTIARALAHFAVLFVLVSATCEDGAGTCHLPQDVSEEVVSASLLQTRIVNLEIQTEEQALNEEAQKLRAPDLPVPVPEEIFGLPGKPRDLDIFVSGLLEISAGRIWPPAAAKVQLAADKAEPEASYAEMLEELEVVVQSTGEILEGHTEAQGQLGKQTATYDGYAKSLNYDTICETGFNAGHSALRFLAQSEANVYEFDFGSHNYSKLAANYLSGRFGNRLHNLWGDSMETVPKFHAEHPDVKCKLVIVDGGHQFDVALADLTNFGQMADADHLLILDDTPCNRDYCEGPTLAWKQLIQEGCVAETQSVAMGEDRGFSVGRYTECPRWPDMNEAEPGEDAQAQHVARTPL